MTQESFDTDRTSKNIIDQVKNFRIIINFSVVMKIRSRTSIRGARAHDPLNDLRPRNDLLQCVHSIFNLINEVYSGL